MALPEFHNEPLTDFSTDAGRTAMQQALRTVAAQLGKEFPLVIGGQRVTTKDKFNSYNPSLKDEVVAVCQKPAADHVQTAVAAAERAYASWSRVPAEERAAILLRAADWLRRRKFVASAWQIYEVGKNWAEADADVAETIDHLEFFAREALRYSRGQVLAPHAQEFSEYTYLPLGVVAVIPPWNFPLAIPAGMASAAIATGNTVVMKPSSDSPANAYVFLEALEAAGLPPGVCNIITGPGGTVGDPLVQSPRVRMVAFTGSREVGVRLYEQTAKVQSGQRWLKRCIAEMGGKNAVIIDEEADLEEAVSAAVASGYGFQGQKCSAGSRLVATAPVYKEVVEAFVDRVRALEQGAAKDNSFCGAVINEGAKKKILEYIQIGKTEGRLMAGGEPGDGAGHYVQPTVFVDVPPTARIAQEEIFGPVVAALNAKGFDAALAIAQGTEYRPPRPGFSRNPQKPAQAPAGLFFGEPS